MRSKLAFFLVFLAPAPALAQQLVTFDQVVTITQQGNGSGAFHYTIKPAATEPASWTTPVDYAKGTAYVYLDVMEKPSKRNTAITICFDGNLEGYGCIATDTYTDVGKYESKRVLPTATWQYNQIAWNRRRQEYHLVVKDPALGGTPGGRPATDYVPTKMRVVMTVVPPGGTYTPPMGAASPAVDGGSTDPKDAATGGDAMGTGGSGGAGGSGTGGSTGTGGSGNTSTGGTGGTGTGGAGGSGTGGSSTTSTGGSSAGSNGSGGAGGSGPSGTGGSSTGSGGSRTSPPPSSNPPPMNSGASVGCSVAGSGNGAAGWLLLAAIMVPALLRRGRQKHRADR